MRPPKNRSFLQTELPREGRFHKIEAWATEQIGVSEGHRGPAEVRERLPRHMGLRYNAKATQSPSGGRFDFHLRHLPDTEVIERLARADRFVERTGTLRRPDHPSAATREAEPSHHSDDRRRTPSG